MSKSNWKERALAATKQSQFGAILCAATGTPCEAPCFSGKATITSDNFVMANFTGADGRNHMGAFVGSVHDLIRNTEGLAKHLKLNDEERKELFGVIRGWVATDYSGGRLLKMLEAS